MMHHHSCGPKSWGRHKHWHGGHFRIPVNVLKTDESYELFFATPGRKKEDFKISVQGDELTISYKRPKQEDTEDQNWVRYEYRLVSFERTFQIDDTVDPANISAKYEDGVLQVTLPIKPGSIVPSQDILIA
ncbi:MAG: Hsp20/alpha crystallin family protein [Saprospiraceae bacterium]|nr:Hsp20/alpha crystallin family protein [Saprospiraceae bacterium]